MNAQECLERMPATIRDLENRLFKHKTDTEGLRLQAKVIEADIEAWAAGKEPDGKKRFDNEAQRQPAIRERLRGHDEHRRLLQVIVDRDAVQAKMESTLRYYANAQWNARAIAFSQGAGKALADFHFIDAEAST